MKTRFVLLVLATFLFCNAGSGFASNIMLFPSQDTSIYRQMPDENFGSNSAVWMGFLNVNIYRSDIGEMRMLTQFDLSSVPQGVTVTSATFSVALQSFNMPTGYTSVEASIYKLTQSWIASQATWNNAAANRTSWTTPGGSFSQRPVTSTLFTSNDTNKLISWNITSLVQSWLDNPDTNYGMIMKADYSQTQSAGYFGTMEAELVYRPFLNIQYETSQSQVPEPLSFLLVSISGLIMYIRKRLS